MMNEHELNRVGRIMAGVLRHFPEKFGVQMDEHGWVRMGEFVDQMRGQKERLHWIKPYHLVAIAATDPKGRYQVEGDRIRATYGHSMKLDLDLPTDDIPAKLYYPVTEEEVDIILERGLTPTDRQKVHLSKTYENALSAGLRRAENPIILVVDAIRAIADGMLIQQAGKTVYVTDSVPAEYLSRD
ncbi:MAG TPA: RNA 2'-phosphotransferase [Candidatus Thermoplasmatota archaeon]|jgi:putative RNA 2'-phosphotransferase|nr:RNA 2'-phosphotransferase [Candidatus Thermoplasmatota archaeon]